MYAHIIELTRLTIKFKKNSLFQKITFQYLSFYFNRHNHYFFVPPLLEIAGAVMVFKCIARNYYLFYDTFYARDEKCNNPFLS